MDDIVPEPSHESQVHDRHKDNSRMGVDRDGSYDQKDKDELQHKDTKLEGYPWRSRKTEETSTEREGERKRRFRMDKIRIKM